MSIKFTAPTNLSRLKLGDVITFQGQAANEIIKVELIADEIYKLRVQFPSNTRTSPNL
ncbi:MAG: hypothetical protein AAFY21_14100 [Cyanobacteria bacterium J06641_2]